MIILKYSFRRCLMFGLFLSIGNISAFAQIGKLYTLLLIDEYSEIAPACFADRIKIEEEAQIIAQKTRMELKLINLPFERSRLIQYLDTFSVQPEDVILFYFTGHGYRYENQRECEDYPYLFISKERVALSEAGLCFGQLSEQLLSKNARLLVSLADCCNNVLPVEEPIAMSNRGFSEVYKRLFLQTEGYLIASSSLPGQFSYATNNGGYFTNSFLQSIRELEDPRQDINQVNWDLVMRKTKSLTILNSKSKQKPQYKAELEMKEEVAIPGQVILPKNH